MRRTAPYARRALKAAALTFLAAVAAALVAFGASDIASDARAAERYADVADAYGPAAGAAPDWAGMADGGIEADAWLAVAGTSIDTPVMQADDDDPERWLYRAADGTPSPTGCPFVDHRCTASSDVTVVYGHRTAYLGYMFHDLADCYDQGAFDRLGTARLDVPGTAPTTFEPLCATSVGRDDATWQGCLGLPGTSLPAWLAETLPKASARCATADADAASARRLLVLVTCNGRAFDPPTRTVVVFVSDGK